MRSLLPFVACAVISCGPVVRRDLGGLPQRQVSYDDLCNLQPYFDERARANTRPFRVLDEQSTETESMENDEHGRPQRLLVGDGRYQVLDRRARARLRDLLAAEYDRIPDLGLTNRDTVVELHANWWSSGRVRRLRPDQEVELRVGERTVRLPAHPCLGEFLFNEPIYALRRAVLDSDATRARGTPESASAPVVAVETLDAASVSDAVALPADVASTRD